MSREVLASLASLTLLSFDAQRARFSCKEIADLNESTEAATLVTLERLEASGDVSSLDSYYGITTQGLRGVLLP